MRYAILYLYATLLQIIHTETHSNFHITHLSSKHIQSHRYLFTHTHIQSHAKTHTQSHEKTQICVHYIRISIRMNYTYPYTHTYKYTHTHSHTHILDILGVSSSQSICLVYSTSVLCIAIQLCPHHRISSRTGHWQKARNITCSSTLIHNIINVMLNYREFELSLQKAENDLHHTLRLMHKLTDYITTQISSFVPLWKVFPILKNICILVWCIFRVEIHKIPNVYEYMCSLDNLWWWSWGSKLSQVPPWQGKPTKLCQSYGG